MVHKLKVLQLMSNSVDDTPLEKVVAPHRELHVEDVRILVCVLVPAPIKQRPLKATISLTYEDLGLATNLVLVAEVDPVRLLGHRRMVGISHMMVERLRRVQRMRQACRKPRIRESIHAIVSEARRGDRHAILLDRL